MLTLFVDEIDHLTPHWSQRYPYNEFCPFASNGHGGHARAGCTAVAGANVLYYLHNKIGLPATMVSQAIYDEGDNEWLFHSPSSSVWSAMDTLSVYGLNYYNLPESIMIGHVGKMIGTHYGGNYSWAWFSNLKSNLFSPYGISCSQGDYDEAIVASSLLNLMPVIITASNLLIPIDFDIHVFVADAYRRTQIKYTHRHHWVGPIPSPDPEAGFIILDGEYDDYYTFTYSSPQVTSIKFNWGWPEQWNDYEQFGADYSVLNNGWYSLTDGWVIDDGNHTYDYNHNRSMIYGFAPAQ